MLNNISKKLCDINSQNNTEIFNIIIIYNSFINNIY